VCSLPLIIVPIISQIVAGEFSDSRKYNVGNISILSIVIGASHEIVYYHKLLKILESYSIYPNLIIRWTNNVYLRKSAKGMKKGEDEFSAPTRLGQQIFHHVSHHTVERYRSSDLSFLDSSDWNIRIQ
jgi:hypothetical protein